MSAFRYRDSRNRRHAAHARCGRRCALASPYQLDRLQLTHGAPLDSFLEVRTLQHVCDVNAGGHDGIRIELTELDDFLDLGNRHGRRGRHHRVEVPRGLPVNQVAFRVAFVRFDEREVCPQWRFQHVVAAVDYSRPLPLSDDRAVAGRREEPANPGAAGADTFGECPLRHQGVLNLANDRLPLEFLVFANVAANEMRHLLRPDEHPDAEVVNAWVVADDGQVAGTAGVQRPDQIFRQAAQAEAAAHDGRYVRYEGEGIGGAG